MEIKCICMGCNNDLIVNFDEETQLCYFCQIKFFENRQIQSLEAYESCRYKKSTKWVWVKRFTYCVCLTFIPAVILGFYISFTAEVIYLVGIIIGQCYSLLLDWLEEWF